MPLSVLDDYENSLFNSQKPLSVSLRAKSPNGNLKSFHHNFPDFKRVSVNIYFNFKDMFSFGPAHNITFTNFAIEGVLCSISFTSDLGYVTYISHLTEYKLSIFYTPFSDSLLLN